MEAYQEERSRDKRPSCTALMVQRKMSFRELDRYEIFQGFIFPDDFSDKLTTIMYQKHNSDILRVSENMLLQAAFLAERGT